MLLDQLKDFEWLNDPFDVSFDDKGGMSVVSFEQTDFWQSLHHNVQKDNGHLFFTRKNSDFSLSLKWQFEGGGQFDQCGLMVRLDNRNWMKVSMMYEDNAHPKLGTSVTNKGYSDWAAQDIPVGTKEIWYKVKRLNGDFLVFFSLDGMVYKQIRLFHFLTDMSEVKVGAYICSPHKKNFRAYLSEIELG